VLYFTTEHVELTKDLLLMSVVGLLFVAVNCPFYMLLIALDMKTKIMKTFFVLSLFTILCCCCLLYLFGVIGALLTLIITEALYSVLMILIWKTRK
jgi:O-antigen/teichoic acid export membrane protein